MVYGSRVPVRVFAHIYRVDTLIHVSLKGRLVQCHVGFIFDERKVREKGGCFMKQLPH